MHFSREGGGGKEYKQRTGEKEKGVKGGLTAVPRCDNAGDAPHGNVTLFGIRDWEKFPVPSSWGKKKRRNGVTIVVLVAAVVKMGFGDMLVAVVRQW
jgi:hypothetical protein